MASVAIVSLLPVDISMEEMGFCIRLDRIFVSLGLLYCFNDAGHFFRWAFYSNIVQKNMNWFSTSDGTEHKFIERLF